MGTDNVVQHLAFGRSEGGVKIVLDDCCEHRPGLRQEVAKHALRGKIASLVFARVFASV